MCILPEMDHADLTIRFRSLLKSKLRQKIDEITIPQIHNQPNGIELHLFSAKYQTI